MNLLILDTTSKIIEAVLGGAVSANQPEYTVQYADTTVTTLTEGSSSGALNSTTDVTIASAPAASTKRVIKEISVYNKDTASINLTIKMYDGTNERIVWKGEVGVGITWLLSSFINNSADALTANSLAQFASTTSSELAGVISDETGTGSLVFADSPTLVTPLLGTPFSGNLANCTFPTLNQNTTGSAATLTTPRAINGVDFDGSAPITVTADANTLSNTTLKSTVVTSSLTSVGTLTGLTVNSPTITLSQDTNFVLSGGVNGVSFNTDTLSIDATNGRVGIGTTAPAYKLDVTGDIRALGDARFGTSVGDTKITGLPATGGNFNFGQTSSSGKINFVSSTDAYLITILNAGNVGIGTTAPIAKTSIYNSGDNSAESVYNSTKGLTISQGSDTAGAYSLLRFGNWNSSSQDNNEDGTYIQSITVANNETDLALGAYTNNGANERMRIKNTGNVGIGTTAPTNLLSLGGNTARIFWLERHTTANTAGNTLTITAGGATAGATDKAGGALILQGGLSTGSAESGVTIQGVVAGASGTADRTQTTAIQVLGNKIGFFNTAAAVQQAYAAISDPPTQAQVTAIRDALINLGLMASS